MSTPTRGVPVELDRVRHFRYSLATMRALEEKFGGLKFEGIGPTIHAIWLGLKHEDPDLTEDQVAEMIDGQNLAEVTTAMAKALGSEDELVPPEVDPTQPRASEGNAEPVATIGSSAPGPKPSLPESQTTSSGA